VKNDRSSYTAGPGERTGGAVPHITNPRPSPSQNWKPITRKFAKIQLWKYIDTDAVLNLFRNTWFPDKKGTWPDLPDPARAPNSSIQWPFSSGPDASLPDEMNALLDKSVWNAGVFQPNVLDGAELERLGKWFLSNWLEDYVYLAFAGALLGHCHTQVVAGVRFAPLEFQGEEMQHQKSVYKDFEIDVAVILGYQLVAISCYAGSSAQTAKQKGFEAIHRARQLGGNEALAILVCLVKREDAKEVEKELDAQARTFGVPIRVWYKNEIQNIDAKVSQFFKEIDFR
jgi:hypothetical protein